MTKHSLLMCVSNVLLFFRLTLVIYYNLNLLLSPLLVGISIMCI